ncbi:hypothetical protein [Nonomuraea sp. B1E8]|uniref:hypothetical protein n=1 Tax=unclassified Nonomuraea TaxID=2593643 RepID=UPI00325E886F
MADGDSGEDVWAERMTTALARTSALRIVCTLALRHLLTLMVPTTVMLTPIGLLAAATLPIVAADHLLVVNGRIDLVGDASMPLFAWLGGLLLVSVPAAAVAGAATMLIAAGRALGRPVHWRFALRAAVRRARGLTALAFIQLAFLALTLAVGMALIVFLNPWVGIAATVVIGLVLMPTLLAMPAFVMEGLGPFGALRRGYRLVETMRVTSPILLAISVIIVPGLASSGFGWVADRLPYPVDISMSSVTAVLLAALQAAVLAVVFLNRIANQWHGVSRPELRAIVDRLPEQDGPRTRRAAVLAVLVLPGLLTGSFAAVNPLGWVEVSDHVAGLSPVDEAGDDHGPFVRPFGLRIGDSDHAGATGPGRRGRRGRYARPVPRRTAGRAVGDRLRGPESRRDQAARLPGPCLFRGGERHARRRSLPSPSRPGALRRPGVGGDVRRQAPGRPFLPGRCLPSHEDRQGQVFPCAAGHVPRRDRPAGDRLDRRELV